MHGTPKSGSEGCLLLQVDAFTAEAFRGNPAAVCFLDGARGAEWMQAVAGEMNLAETAFLVRRGEVFDLRWFTPAVEVPLCGHATLASAHAIWEEGVAEGPLRFATLSGELRAEREGDWIRLDFPVKPPVAAPIPAPLAETLGVQVAAHAVCDNFHLVEVSSAEEVRKAAPDMRALLAVGDIRVIVTSRGEGEFDFVSRFFAPSAGIDEDPVTGSAHCMLAPYWRQRLGRDEMTAFQASRRGGVVRVRCADGGRVHLLGQALTTLRGRLLA